jgi:phosphoglycerate dehydrogenase-like enzyme
MLDIWTNLRLPPDDDHTLRTALACHRMLRPAQLDDSNLVSAAPDDSFLQADIAFGQPAVADLLRSSRLKWVQLSSAGFTRYDTAEVRLHVAKRRVVVTNASGVYDEPCAAHLLAMMLASCRALPESMHAQSSRQWQYSRMRPRTQVLRDQHVLILGFGSIGKRLVQMLRPHAPRITGARRTIRGDEGIDIVKLDAACSELDAALRTADHIVNVLPEASGTIGFFNHHRIGQMKPGARFYNVGRGTTVDQNALADALANGRLAGAYLDVVDPEPLPPDHFLWTTKNCHITPHVAGGFAQEHARLVEHFLANLKRFEAGEALVDRIM